MRIAVLIPAYQPGETLVDLVRRLGDSALDPIVIVDDGSGPAFASVFERCRLLPRVRVLAHSVNRGKGAALKTGMRCLAEEYPDCAGAVTADADGQHDAGDVRRVAGRLRADPGALVLGSREFGPAVPWRNRAGNLAARGVLRLLAGINLRDTQTGLRGIPRALFPRLLEFPSDGFEFELDMLMAAKHWGCPLAEESIRTIYPAGPLDSHFDPLRDSMRVSFVLLRFTLLSLATAALDNLVFLSLFETGVSAVRSQIGGRLAAVLVNYPAARRAVFLSNEAHRKLLPKYLLLVAASGAVSYGLIRLLHASAGVPVIWAKVLAESALFVLNFLVQRDYVFTRAAGRSTTDWDRYYRSVPPAARLARRYTAACLVAALKRAHPRVIVELGGANSCFVERIAARLNPEAYHVVDTNEYGLELLRHRIRPGWNVRLHRGNVLGLRLDVEADTVFSVGLIEHFPPDGTRQAIQAHFDLLPAGGYAVLSFPTPTLLYRAARALTEAAGLWRFPDERPIGREEVLQAAAGQAELLSERVLWPLVFTQRLMVFRRLPRGGQG